MKPCNITSKSLIIARLFESNKTTAQLSSVQYLVSACIIYFILAFWYIIIINHKKMNGKECIHVIIANYCIYLLHCLLDNNNGSLILNPILA
jgi:hypothetical protein